MQTFTHSHSLLASALSSLSVSPDMDDSDYVLDMASTIEQALSSIITASSSTEVIDLKSVVVNDECRGAIVRLIAIFSRSFQVCVKVVLRSIPSNLMNPISFPL